MECDMYTRREVLLDTLRAVNFSLASIAQLRPVPTKLRESLIATERCAIEELKGMGCDVYWSSGGRQWMATYPVEERGE